MSDLDDAIRKAVDARLRELGIMERPQPDEYLSTKDAAGIAGVAAVTIRRWVKGGKLREHRAGRLMRVKRADLERLLREGYVRNDDSLTPEQMARRKYG